MKKLIIAMFAIAAAVSANAAAVTWSSGALKTPTSAEGGWSGTTITSGSATGYFWVIDSLAFDALYSADAATMQANVMAKYATQANGKVTVTDSSFKNPTAKTTVVTYKDDGGYGAGDTAYAAMIFVYTEGEQDYYIANVGKYEFASASNKTVAGMATNVNSSGASIGGWTAAESIPEPTSGLLLLLGMAGLALRRKQA